jgi:hypothetical protein
VLELHNGIVRPQTLAQIFSRYQLARVLQEHDQDSQRLLGETDRLVTVFAKFPGPEI